MSKLDMMYKLNYPLSPMTAQEITNAMIEWSNRSTKDDRIREILLTRIYAAALMGKHTAFVSSRCQDFTLLGLEPDFYELGEWLCKLGYEVSVEECYISHEDFMMIYWSENDCG